jgi:hypothetical protein
MQKMTDHTHLRENNVPCTLIGVESDRGRGTAFMPFKNSWAVGF